MDNPVKKGYSCMEFHPAFFFDRPTSHNLNPQEVMTGVWQQKVHISGVARVDYSVLILRAIGTGKILIVDCSVHNQKGSNEMLSILDE